MVVCLVRHPVVVVRMFMFQYIPAEVSVYFVTR